MSKVTIELEQEQLDAIVVRDLSTLLECLEKDLAKVRDHKKGYVFETDWKDDEKELKKHIKSFKRVLRYYGEAL